MSAIRKKIKDLSSIGVATIVGAAISAIFWLFLASIMEPDAYGEIFYYMAVAQVASTIALIGAANTLVVYTAKKIKIQSTVYIISIISGSITSLGVFFLLYHIGTSLLILGYVVFVLVTSELLGQKLFLNYSKFVITQRILFVCFAIGMYYLIGDEGVILGMALSYTPYIWGIVKIFKNTKINFSLWKKRKEFIGNNYLQSLSSTLSGSLDKLFIAPLFGFVLLGNYSLGLQFYALLMLLPNVVSTYIVPQDSSGYENKNLKKIIILASVGFAILGFTIGPWVISNIFPKFAESEEVIRIISWAVIPNTIVIVYSSKFLGNEKTRYLMISSFIATGVQVLGIVLLGNMFGVNGIAVAFLLAATCAAIYNVIIDKRDKTKQISK